MEEKEKEKKSPDRPADSAPRKLMNVDFLKKRFSKKAVRIEREGKIKTNKTFDQSNETGERCKRFSQWDVVMGGLGEREGMDGRVSGLVEVTQERPESG